MRNFYALSCCLFLTLLFLGSAAQTIRQDSINFSVPYLSRNFLSAKNDVYALDSLTKKTLPNLHELSFLKMQPQRIVQNYFKQKLPPVNFGKPALEFKNTVLTAQATNNSIEVNDQEREYIRQANFSSNVTFLSIPVSLSYVSNDGWNSDFKPMSYTTTKFDKETYLKQIRDKIIKINPEVAFKSLLAPLYQKRDEAINNIRADLMDVITKKSPVNLSGIQGKINAENLNFLGVDQFLNKILVDIKSEITRKENLFNELNGRKDKSKEIIDSISFLADELLKLKTSQPEFETQVSQLRQKWFNSGIMNIIGSFEKDKHVMISQWLNDPAKLVQVGEKYLQLPGIQKLLLHAKSLNFGASGIPQNDLNFKDVLVKGVNAAFLNGKTFIAPVLGVQPALKNITDFNYSNFSELPSILTSSLRIGKGDIQKDFSHISVSLFQQSSNTQFMPGNATGLNLPKNIVTTFSKKIELSSSQSMVAEISKSTMLYSNSGNKGRGAGDGLINGNSFFANMGVSLEYSGDFEKLGINNRTHIRFTGNEYVNLGNYALPSGVKEVTNDFRKFFFNRKMIVNLKANYREYDFSTYNRKWLVYSYTVDVKRKFKRGEFIELRYQPYYNQKTGDNNSMRSKSERLSVRGNVARKVFKGLSYRNYSELSISNDSYYDVLADQVIANRFLSFSTQQNLVLGTQAVFLNFSGSKTKKNAGYIFGNSYLTIDVGASFLALKTISLSSSLVYNEVSEMYRQLAIRQSVNILIGKRIVVEGVIYTGKYLYEKSGLNMPSSNGNLAIRYNLK